MKKKSKISLPVPLSFVLILLAALALRMTIAFLSGGDPISGVLSYRPFVEACNVGPAVLAMLTLDYGCILFVFILLRKSWPGRGVVKGLIFGAAFGVQWFYGMLEASFALGIPLAHEFFFGLSEIPAILLMGHLAGLLFKVDTGSASDTRDKEGSRIRVVDFFIALFIACALGLGRFFSYAVVKVEPAWQTLPYTMWTIGFALLVGGVYLVLGRNLPGKGIKKALLFAFFVFGLNWMLFNLFVPYLFVVPGANILHNFILRVVLDCTYIAAGILVATHITKRLGNY
jgi:hypothetical protein